MGCTLKTVQSKLMTAFHLIVLSCSSIFPSSNSCWQCVCDFYYKMLNLTVNIKHGTISGSILSRLRSSQHFLKYNRLEWYGQHNRSCKSRSRRFDRKAIGLSRCSEDFANKFSMPGLANSSEPHCLSAPSSSSSCPKLGIILRRRLAPIGLCFMMNFDYVLSVLLLSVSIIPSLPLSRLMSRIIIISFFLMI